MKKTKPQCKTCDNHAGGGLDFCYQCLGAILDRGRGEWQPRRIDDSNRPSVEAYKPHPQPHPIKSQISGALAVHEGDEEEGEQDSPKPPQPLVERFDALEQMLSYNHILWVAVFAVWHYENEVNGHGIAHTIIEPLTGLGQFVAETAHARA